MTGVDILFVVGGVVLVIFFLILIGFIMSVSVISAAMKGREPNSVANFFVTSLLRVLNFFRK